ncbi:Cysteine desulfurase [Hibiscus syriacus]|uniref:cysteine desulfurase n=1 Tax=Hibiscus syriacus TaxID=106335 RepID=A0A6A2YAM6_HIBSY|nr:cysteine desulfurase, mitochondrial-like [Hibiscus syriacus]KAE8671489.1 Cysteine desulfurase [Hibiscus syriacus]
MASQLLRQTLTKTKPSAVIRRLSTASAVAVASPAGNDEPTGITMKGVKISGRPLYLDMQATTPVDPRVLDSMLPFYLSRYGNPHSRTHLYGWESETAVETARAQVAALIGASPKEIVFTSGATESNNISVKGVMHFYKEKKRHVITTQTEHKCVLDSCRHLQQEGFEVTYLPVGSDGLIDLDRLRKEIRPDTGLVSIMAVNNEIGVVQPVEEIGKICKEFNVPFHTDAAQALGKIKVDVEKWNVSLMSLSGHKIYGPKGVGALYMRRRPRIRVEPQMNGGGQERGIRSGTVPTPLVVGMGAACEVAMKEMEYDEKRIKGLQERLLNGIREKIDGVVVNGCMDRRYVGNLNLSFAYVEGESLLMGLKEVAVSSGSACTSASLEPSYVLRALGVDEDMAHTSIRFGIGRFTTEEEIDKAVELTVKQVEKLREMSPLYEMVKEGIDIKQIQWAQH